MGTINPGAFLVLSENAKKSRTNIRYYVECESQSDPSFFRWFFQDLDLEDFQNPDQESLKKWLDDNCKELTKEEVLSFLQSELECGNSIITATIGQGGAGLDISNTDITGDLKDMQFNGLADLICDDIVDCEETQDCTVYEFETLSDKNNPLRIQVCVY